MKILLITSNQGGERLIPHVMLLSNQGHKTSIELLVSTRNPRFDPIEFDAILCTRYPQGRMGKPATLREIIKYFTEARKRKPNIHCAVCTNLPLPLKEIRSLKKANIALVQNNPQHIIALLKFWE